MSAVRALTFPMHSAMGAGAPRRPAAAQGADGLALDRLYLSGQRGVCIALSALALGGGEVLIGNQPGPAVRAGVFGIFQDTFDHIFVPARRVLVVADALMGHLLRNSEEGGPGLILAEDVLYRVRFLGLGLNHAAPDHVSEGDLSLPCHGSHQPFHQLQPVEEPESHFFRRDHCDPFHQILKDVGGDFILPLGAVQIVQHGLGGLNLLVPIGGLQHLPAQAAQVTEFAVEGIRLG